MLLLCSLAHCLEVASTDNSYITCRAQQQPIEEHFVWLQAVLDSLSVLVMASCFVISLTQIILNVLYYNIHIKRLKSNLLLHLKKVNLK